MGLSVVGIGDIVRSEIDFFFTPFFHAFFPSAAGSRSYQKPARFRVRAGSAQRQVARPIRVGEVQDLIQGRRIGMCRSRQGPGASKRDQARCDRRLAEQLRRADSTNGGTRQLSQALAQPAGLCARGGQLGAGPASLRPRSTAHPLRSRARKALARELRVGGLLASVGDAQNRSILRGRAGVGLTIARERRDEGRIAADP